MELADDFVIVNHKDAYQTVDGAPPPPYLSEISSVVDGLADDLWPVNKKIHDNPELGFKEFIAHETLTTFMKSRPGWKVTPSAYGMATAWVAVFDTRKKGPVVSFNAEMDALDGIGHACGHNLIATASVAGALATAEMMKQRDLGGKVVLFGTPAEEGGGGKIKLLEAGAYRDHRVDISLIAHPGTVADSALVRTAAFEALTVSYAGREAHAAANPWLGINALDALVTAYNSLSVLRQQTMPGDVLQAQISHGGVRPNVIHAYAAGHFVVRAPTRKRLRVLRRQADACFEAGALATGATLTARTTRAYADHVPNRALGHVYRRYFNALLPEHNEDPDKNPSTPIPENDELAEIVGRTMASTDQGDVSYALPSLHTGFAIAPGPGGNGPHHPEFAEAAGTRAAFARCLRAAKGLAGVAVEVLAVAGLLAEVKEEWRREVKGKEG